MVFLRFWRKSTLLQITAEWGTWERAGAQWVFRAVTKRVRCGALNGCPWPAMAHNRTLARMLRAGFGVRIKVR